MSCLGDVLSHNCLMLRGTRVREVELTQFYQRHHLRVMEIHSPYNTSGTYCRYRVKGLE